MRLLPPPSFTAPYSGLLTGLSFYKSYYFLPLCLTAYLPVWLLDSVPVCLPACLSARQHAWLICMLNSMPDCLTVCLGLCLASPVYDFLLISAVICTIVSSAALYRPGKTTRRLISNDHNNCPLVGHFWVDHLSLGVIDRSTLNGPSSVMALLFRTLIVAAMGQSNFPMKRLSAGGSVSADREWGGGTRRTPI